MYNNEIIITCSSISVITVMLLKRYGQPTYTHRDICKYEGHGVSITLVIVMVVTLRFLVLQVVFLLFFY